MKFFNLDTNLGKDITNFRTGWYRNFGNRTGYIDCYPDGVWNDVVSISVGRQDENKYYHKSLSYVTIADANSTFWQGYKKRYSYNNNTDTYTEQSGTPTKPSKTTYSNTELSQFLESEKTKTFLEIYGADKISEFVNWAENKAFTDEFDTGFWNYEDGTDFIGNAVIDHIYYVNRNTSIPTTENVFLSAAYLYWYTQIKGLKLKDGKETNSDEITKKLIIEWKLNIDGTYDPELTFSWNSNSFKDVFNTNTTKVSIFIKNSLEETKLFKEVSYNENMLRFKFSDLLKLYDDKLFNDYISGILDLLDINYIYITFYAKDYNKDVESSGGFIQLSSSGDVPRYESFGEDVILITQNMPTPPEDGEEDNGGSDEDDTISDDTNTYQSPYNGLNKTYIISLSKLQTLGNFLWSADFTDNIRLINNSPIENILSVKLFPMNLPWYNTTSENIILGNVNTGITGFPVLNDSNMTLDGGNITIPRYFNNFLDYEPFTKCTLFIPFIGFKEIQPSHIVGKTINIKYIIDLVNGLIKANIYGDNNIKLYSYDGQIGIDIPISASNRTQVELSYIGAIAGTIASVASSNIAGVTYNIAQGLSSQYHTQTNGVFSPLLGLYDSMEAYCIVDRPNYILPSNYGKTIGFKSNTTQRISSLIGYTKCENVNVDNITALEEEKREIKEKLENGFYI